MFTVIKKRNSTLYRVSKTSATEKASIGQLKYCIILSNVQIFKINKICSAKQRKQLSTMFTTAALWNKNITLPKVGVVQATNRRDGVNKKKLSVITAIGGRHCKIAGASMSTLQLALELTTELVELLGACNDTGLACSRFIQCL